MTEHESPSALPSDIKLSTDSSSLINSHCPKEDCWCQKSWALSWQCDHYNYIGLLSCKHALCKTAVKSLWQKLEFGQKFAEDMASFIIYAFAYGVMAGKCQP